MQTKRNQEINLIQVTDYTWAVALVVSMHIAGFIGLQWQPSRAFFEMLIPFNLVSSTVILLYFHQDWRSSFIAFIAISFCVGFGIEWLGVHTGVIFGSYQYGSTLGFKLDEIPLIIGLNWLVLIYATGNIAMRFHSSIWMRVLIGASLMVLIDILIEPVAIKHQMWSWNHDAVPIRNYLAWFSVSGLLLFVFFNLNFKKDNYIAIWIYSAQFFFFLFHNLTYFINFF